MKRIAFYGGVYEIDLGENMGSEQSGLRPCICVSNNINNTKSNIVQVVPLTSQTKNPLPIHHLLKRSDYKFLNFDSIVLAEQITTKSVNRIKYFLGRINDQDMRKIKGCIDLQLNLSNKGV